MKTRFPLYLLASLFIGFCSTACNSDSDDDEETPDLSAESSLIINSFSLDQNDKVLENLANVFFTIDLNNAVVFNADSLPLDTDVSSLVIKMSLSSPSVAKITMPGKQQTDTVVDFLTSATTPINFNRGYVTLDMTSANGLKTMRYTLKVNVHRTDADSLCWGSTNISVLPGSISPMGQKTVMYQNKALCFTADMTSAVRSVTATPDNFSSWQSETVTLPAGCRLGTLTASADALYIIAGDDQLYTSADMGSTWTDTGASMSHIYGDADGLLAGVRHVSGTTYNLVTYPSTTETPAPDGFPVAWTSEPIVYSSDWSQSKQMIILGGETATGAATGNTWSFDGTEWACISVDPIPNLKGVAVVPYFAVRVDSDWLVTRRTILLAIGGIDGSGALNTKVYLSYDRGLHWAEAPEHMQLPEELAPRAYAQALVFDSEFNASSRASKPITEWECPYIYLFGGTDDSSQLYDQIWRGVINRFTFKPIQ